MLCLSVALVPIALKPYVPTVAVEAALIVTVASAVPPIGSVTRVGNVNVIPEGEVPTQAIDSPIG